MAEPTTDVVDAPEIEQDLDSDYDEDGYEAPVVHLDGSPCPENCY